eukprot:GHVR01009041.1.p1 GENE.GHVR01009041.1~~GHVR01009041.1.p1  ORF type:complete len:200 (-),score=73.10 GHVR01009041.1:105-620(-)
MNNCKALEPIAANFRRIVADYWRRTRIQTGMPFNRQFWQSSLWQSLSYSHGGKEAKVTGKSMCGRLHPPPTERMRLRERCRGNTIPLSTDAPSRQHSTTPYAESWRVAYTQNHTHTGSLHHTAHSWSSQVKDSVGSKGCYNDYSSVETYSFTHTHTHTHTLLIPVVKKENQ